MEKETLTLEYVLRTFNTKNGRDKKTKCEIYLNGVSLGLVNSAIYDGARLLMKMGYHPDTLLTSKSKYSQHNSWHPKPLSHWAKFTTEETDDRSVRVKAYVEWGGVAPTEASKPLPLSPYQNTIDATPRVSPAHCECVA